jgi:hypothetical protein
MPYVVGCENCYVEAIISGVLTARLFEAATAKRCLIIAHKISGSGDGALR